jgi:hypothetical protein
LIYPKGEQPEIGRHAPTRPGSAVCHKAFYMPVAAVRNTLPGNTIGRPRRRAPPRNRALQHAWRVRHSSAVRPAFRLRNLLPGGRIQPDSAAVASLANTRIKYAPIARAGHSGNREEPATFASAQTLITRKLHHSGQERICLRIGHNMIFFSSHCVCNDEDDIEFGNHTRTSRAHHDEKQFDSWRVVCTQV